jgi:hypothetical protein
MRRARNRSEQRRIFFAYFSITGGKYSNVVENCSFVSYGYTNFSDDLKEQILTMSCLKSRGTSTSLDIARLVPMSAGCLFEKVVF